MNRRGTERAVGNRRLESHARERYHPNLLRGGRSDRNRPSNMVALPRLKLPPASDRENFLHWLNLPDPADPALPSLFLIGDSTVRNGRGDGIDGLGQWGWGDPLTAWFDPRKSTS